MTATELSQWEAKSLAESKARRSEALTMLPQAQALCRCLGPFQGAGDDTAWGLAMAYANTHWLTGKWCECRIAELRDCSETHTWRYFARQDGQHGWFCVRCGGYVQIG